MEPIVRRAERADASLILDLITALATFEKLTPPDAAARQRFAEDGWGNQPRFDAWVADKDGAVVGYAITFFMYSSFLCRPTLYLEDLFVLPEYRGEGLGYRLFHAAAQEGRAQGCGRMEWACLDWNTNAQRFYESLGARRMGEWYYYRLVADQLETLPAPKP